MTTIPSKTTLRNMRTWYIGSVLGSGHSSSWEFLFFQVNITRTSVCLPRHSQCSPLTQPPPFSSDMVNTHNHRALKTLLLSLWSSSYPLAPAIEQTRTVRRLPHMSRDNKEITLSPPTGDHGFSQTQSPTLDEWEILRCGIGSEFHQPWTRVST